MSALWFYENHIWRITVVLLLVSNCATHSLSAASGNCVRCSPRKSAMSVTRFLHTVGIYLSFKYQCS